MFEWFYSDGAAGSRVGGERKVLDHSSARRNVE
jgi:hypothetical protein